MHPQILLDPAWNGGPPGEPKSIKIFKNSCIFPVPSKSRKSEPRVTKSLPKWCPKPSLGHLKVNLLLNCKSNENHCIYYVLKTSRRRILVPCLLPNQQKNNYGIRAAIGWSKWRKSHQYGSKVGPKGVPKSIKNLLKSKSGPKVSCWVSLGASGSTKWCPGTPKSHPGTSKCTCQASEQVSQVAKMEPRVYQIVNQLLARWRGVNNWILYYITLW